MLFLWFCDKKIVHLVHPILLQAHNRSPLHLLHHPRLQQDDDDDDDDSEEEGTEEEDKEDKEDKEDEDSHVRSVLRMRLPVAQAWNIIIITII